MPLHRAMRSCLSWYDSPTHAGLSKISVCQLISLIPRVSHPNIFACSTKWGDGLVKCVMCSDVASFMDVVPEFFVLSSVLYGRCFCPGKLAIGLAVVVPRLGLLQSGNRK